MTEAEWLASSNPEMMLRALRRRQPSERKLRLFALACCRNVERFITDPRSQAALTFLEQHIETTPNRKKGRPAIEKAAQAAWNDAYSRLAPSPAERSATLVASNAADAAHTTLAADPLHAAIYAAAFAANTVAWTNQIAQGNTTGTGFRDEFREPEEREQVILLRDILGNPFQACAIDPDWLRWNDGTVGKIARAIYEESAFDPVGILADALEDAGCTETEILAHCREPGIHARGCWVVDLVLGQE